MSIVLGIMAPHPPLIIPEVGRGQQLQIRDTVAAYEEAARMAAEIRPDTVVVLSPHSIMYADYFHVSPGSGARGDFGQYYAFQAAVEAAYDQELVQELCILAKKEDFPMGTLGEKNKSLDHGTMIPLYFINQYYRDYKVVRIGPSGLSLADHYRAGRLIAGAAERLGRRVVIVASGDLSHKLKKDGPYGFSPQGPEYDARIMEVMGNARFGELFDFSETFCENAAECGHRGFTMLAGAVDGQAVRPRRLSYEGPFGVGYGVCTFETDGKDEGRRFLEVYERRQQELCSQMREREDTYVSLARKSLEYFVRTGRQLPARQARDGLPEEMLKTRAGVFVSLHKNGALRGCIGTISPVCENVAEEIIQNAVSAGAHDPRFPAVREKELKELVYSVDVLGRAEPIKGPEELDVKRYGVIVTKGQRRGLLLPDLDGVDTVEQQISIARQKAGIGENETGISLERFEVIRHSEKELF